MSKNNFQCKPTIFEVWSLNVYCLFLEAVAQRCSVKRVFLEISQNSHENTCARVSFLIKLETQACKFIKKETLVQAFSCEFYEIFKNIFFTEHLWWLLLDKIMDESLESSRVCSEFNYKDTRKTSVK